MWVTRTTTYRKIEDKITVKLNCKKCGKKRQRVLTEWGTSNPFNNFKDPSEIRKENRKKLEERKEELLKGGLICNGC